MWAAAFRPTPTVQGDFRFAYAELDATPGKKLRNGCVKFCRDKEHKEHTSRAPQKKIQRHLLKSA
jgi:hypothetical protein